MVKEEEEGRVLEQEIIMMRGVSNVVCSVLILCSSFSFLSSFPPTPPLDKRVKSGNKGGKRREGRACVCVCVCVQGLAWNGQVPVVQLWHGIGFLTHPPSSTQTPPLSFICTTALMAEKLGQG